MTNKHFLVRVLRDSVFAGGGATTAFIGARFPADALAPPAPGDAHWALAAAAIWRRGRDRAGASLAGWRNSNPAPSIMRLRHGDTVRELRVEPRAEAALDVGLDGRATVIHLDDRADVAGHVRIDGVRRAAQLLAHDGGWLVEIDGLAARFTDATHEAARGAAGAGDGTLRAPMDGRIVAIRVASGDAVEKGQTIVVLEAMKMQHQIRAAAAGTVATLPVKEGEQVSARTVLATMAAS